MKKYTFVKGYRENEPLRDSFNQLATKTFGIDFEAWYLNGFWTDKYQPYSFTDNGQIVANVSVKILNLVINNETFFLFNRIIKSNILHNWKLGCDNNGKSNRNHYKRTKAFIIRDVYESG
ncbi:hypothetical protein [Neobacillus niacini]|uniref:hypothetical protein n=1 Tax=Neobacillus niacini TaxID=86668 RepID=UPI0005EF6C62|nr:hypothetical protein [Neobacillus niacini]